MALIATRIQDRPFDASEEYRLFCQMRDPDEGAVVMFLGQVRAQRQDEPIIDLAIEHYPQMAEKLLARLAESAAQQFSLTRLTIIHRIGRLAPSEAIVLVLAASAHRAQAFDANREIVERLKHEIPLWKKEVTARGSFWVTPPSGD